MAVGWVWRLDGKVEEDDGVGGWLARTGQDRPGHAQNRTKVDEAVMGNGERALLVSQTNAGRACRISIRIQFIHLTWLNGEAQWKTGFP